jgi:hypothetical protein
MSESPPDARGGPTGGRPGRAPAPPRGSRPPVLSLVVVRYDGAPDRATVHPPGLTGLARMETWLSTDRSAVVELAAWR